MQRKCPSISILTPALTAWIFVFGMLQAASVQAQPRIGAALCELADTCEPVIHKTDHNPRACSRRYRKLFFENCWWRVYRCRGPRTTQYHCITCPDLPPRYRCPGT